MTMKLALLALATTLATGSATAAANLVVNGSFEGPDGLAGWRIGGTTGDDLPPAAISYNLTNGQRYPIGAQGESVPTDNAVSPSPDAAGAKGVYFVSDQATNLSVYQVIHLDPGSYDVGFDSYDTYNGAVQPADAHLTAEILGTTVADFSLSSVQPGAWSTHEGVANIKTAGDYLVSFAFNTPDAPTNAKDVVIDRVYVLGDPDGGGIEIPSAGTPEPATWLMMILGIGMTGGVLRRRAVAAAATA